jgi:hypothetical protein
MANCESLVQVYTAMSRFARARPGDRPREHLYFALHQLTQPSSALEARFDLGDVTGAVHLPHPECTPRSALLFVDQIIAKRSLKRACARERRPISARDLRDAALTGHLARLGKHDVPHPRFARATSGVPAINDAPHTRAFGPDEVWTWASRRCRAQSRASSVFLSARRAIRFDEPRAFARDRRRFVGASEVEHEPFGDVHDHARGQRRIDGPAFD